MKWSKTMSKITKKQIVKDICNKKHWDIKESDAINAVKDISDGKCTKYSTMHYKMVYCIVKSKIEKITDRTEQIAYIDCLTMNYVDLGSEKYNKALDIASAILSGTYLGTYVTQGTEDLETIAITAILLLGFQLLKALNLMFRKWDFYQMILKQLKSDLIES